MDGELPDHRSESLALCAVIGVGEWGAGVAIRLRDALVERTGLLAAACPVLAAPEAPPAPEALQQWLFSARSAAALRELEEAGLLALDPVLPPVTHLYLIGSAAEEGGWERLVATASAARAAVRVLHWPMAPVGLLDLAMGTAPQVGVPPLTLYLVRPVTAQGLMLSAQEYQEAMAELLLAAAQPGGSQLLAPEGHGGQVGTLGIAWLRWGPGALKRALADRLARRALLLLLDAPTPLPPDLRGLPAPLSAALNQRFTGLLAGLPLRTAAGAQGLEPAEALFPPPQNRQQPSTHLARCQRVIARRVSRWTQALATSAAAQAAREEEALDQALALAQSPTARLRRLEQIERLLPLTFDISLPELAAANPDRALRQLRQAEALLPVGAHLPWIGLCTLLPAALAAAFYRQSASPWLLLFPALLLLVGAYAASRSRLIRRRAAEAADELTQWAVSQVETELAMHLHQLDQRVLEGVRRRDRDLRAEVESLRAYGTAAPDAQTPPAGGLGIPLEDGAERLWARVADQAADLARTLQQADEDLRHAGRSVAGRSSLEPFDAEGSHPEQLAVQRSSVDQLVERAGRLASARVERLAEADLLPGLLAGHQRLGALVPRLVAWAQPLLSGQPASGDPQRWLLWPEGLPVPPVPPGVRLLAGARGCLAAVTVVRSLHRLDGAGSVPTGVNGPDRPGPSERDRNRPGPRENRRSQ